MERLILPALLAVLLLSCGEKPAKKPNFVFILVDDLGWADIQTNYPDTFYETPNLDRLAGSGMRFTQAYAAHPVCSPTRAALMTGKHPNRVNITDWIPGFSRDREQWELETPAISHQLELEETTLAEKLREGGYQTYFIGKWHLGEEERFWPENQGFDINIGGWSVGAPQLKKGEANGYYAPYGNPRLEDGPEGEYLTDRLTAESIALIQESKDKPFLLYLSFYSVHTPIQPAPRHHEYFMEKREKLQPAATQVTYRQEGTGHTKLIQDNAAYASMIAAMDDNIGKIMEALEESGLDEDTWIILTSDNGGLSTLFTEGAPTANGPLRAGKGWCYEGGIRVPLIIKGPGIKSAGTVSHTPVVSMDMYPTLLSLAGIPEEARDGKNLQPLLEGKNQLDRESLIWHYPHYHGSAWKPGSAIREGKWKLIHFYENQVSELYDLENDPGEKKDLGAEFPEKVTELRQKLMIQLKATGGKVPVRKAN
ncbi:Arylsulfatase A [Cyclobacterium lianum]|uniref:Arylsulfatase A n=1 Tax=Cyclobacterium lianum TaxID=388280 RepID=A0A1M7JI09_9BACT|nr:sulfatase [Cyclobacterium lianum]SHM52672.1 Arylsulfatase A [Cyclobacterium lianum]